MTYTILNKKAYYETVKSGFIGGGGGGDSTSSTAY
jgi:hypothetical protein